MNDSEMRYDARDFYESLESQSRDVGNNGNEQPAMRSSLQEPSLYKPMTATTSNSMNGVGVDHAGSDLYTTNGDRSMSEPVHSNASPGPVPEPKTIPLPADVDHIIEVEWASTDPNNPSPPEYATRPKYSPTEDPCGCTPCYDEMTDTIDTSLCCTDMSCVLFACQEECRSNCEAGELCGNKRITKRQWRDVEVIDAGVKGRGLILGRNGGPAKAGDFIIEYTGVAIKKDYLDSMFRRYRMERMLYIMALDNDVYIDARKKGSIARYINHSCEPNCAVHRWKVRGINRAGIFALRDIRAGEELTFDYKWKRKRGRAPTKCYCKSSKCRGTLEDMLDKTEEEEREEMQLQGHWKVPTKVNGVGKEIMNRTIKVFSEEENEYFLADACKYDPAEKRHCLIYRGEIEETWENLDEREWMILDEEMEQFVITRKAKYRDATAMTSTGIEMNSEGPERSSSMSPSPMKAKNYVIVQTPMKERIFAKHLVDRCQRHFRVQISVIQVFASAATDPEEALEEAKALKESRDGFAWKFTVTGMQPVKAREYLEKNIQDITEGARRVEGDASGGNEDIVTEAPITRHEIVIPRCVTDYVKSRMPLLRNNCKNAEITFTASKSMSKQFAKLIIESEDRQAAFDAQHLLWKEVLTLCNHHDAPRTPKGLFKDLAFYGGELSTEDFNLLCPKLSQVNLKLDCCENLRESAGMASFEDFYRCTIWVQAIEDIGRVNSDNRIETDAKSGKRKIFFGTEPRRIPELWGHIKLRISEIKAGVKFLNMDADKEYLPFISRAFENRPRGMAAAFFDYLQRVTGASVRTDTFSQYCIRIDGTNGVLPSLRTIHLDGTVDNDALNRANMAEEIIRLQMEMMRDTRIRQHRWAFGRDWPLLVSEDSTKETESIPLEKEMSQLSPRPTVARTSNKRYIANACMEISDINEILGLDGSIAAHACVILYRYLNQASENMSQSKQRDILLACLFLANKAQKECKWKRLEIVLGAAYKIFYAGAKFNPEGEEGAAWEKRVLAMENDILKSLEYDIFWGGVDWITTMVTESGHMPETAVKSLMEVTLMGPVFASGPIVWLKLGPEYAFTAMGALTSLDVKHLFSTLSLNPLKVYDAVELITNSILTNRISRQKGSKTSHDIFHDSNHDTFTTLKKSIKDMCTELVGLIIPHANNDNLSGQAKQYQIISRRCGRRRVIRGIDSKLLSEHLLSSFGKIRDQCLCDIYVEEGNEFGSENIIFEGSWRSLALAEDIILEIAKAANYKLKDAEDDGFAPRVSEKLQGRSQPGLLSISSVGSAADWSEISESGWTTKIGGKTCLPGKVKTTALHGNGLRWWLRPSHCQNVKGSLCDTLEIRRSYMENVNTVHRQELASVATSFDSSSSTSLFPLLTKDVAIDLDSNKKEHTAVSLQRWPPEKTEQRERSKGGMDVGVSPAALQEMQILTKLHSVVPGPQGHPNFILPIAIAIDENKESSQDKESQKKKRSVPDLMAGTSDDLLSFLQTIDNSAVRKKEEKSLKGSHLVFQPTPIILQKVMNKNKRKKGEKDINFVIPPALITAWFHDLLSAMSHCHKNHIVLRTLHPDQIFIDGNGVAKLSGLTRSIVLHPTDRDRYLDPLSSAKSKKKSASITDDDISSNPYMAPELLLGATRYTLESDVWTLAALMAHLMIGKPIFSGRDRKSKTRAIFKIVGSPSTNNYKDAQSYPYFNLCKTDKKYKSGVDKALRYMFRDSGRDNADHYAGILSLLERILVLDPRKRMSATDALDHPSMTEFVGWTTADAYRKRFVEDWKVLKESLCSDSTDVDSNIGSMHATQSIIMNTAGTMDGLNSSSFKRPASYLETNLGKTDDDDLYDLDDILGRSNGKKAKI